MNDLGNIADDVFLTNFDNSDLELYRQSIVFDDKLFIKRQAMWDNGRIDPTMHSLWCKEKKDLSFFWKVWDEMKRRRDNRVEYWWILDETNFPLQTVNKK